MHRMAADDKLGRATVLDPRNTRDHVVNGVLILDQDGVYEPTDADVCEFAKYLDIDPRKEPCLLTIAREGLKAPLPRGWKPCVNEDGSLFYYNSKTGESLGEHPCDAKYRERIEIERGHVKSKTADADDAHGHHYKDKRSEDINQRDIQSGNIDRSNNLLKLTNIDSKSTSSEILKELKVQDERNRNKENMGNYEYNDLEREERITICYGYGTNKREYVFQSNSKKEKDDTCDVVVCENVREHEDTHTTRKHANTLAIDGSITDRTEHDDKLMTRKHANALAIDGSITDRTEHDEKHMTREHANTLAIGESITDRTEHDDKHMTREHANALAIDGSITYRTEHDDKLMTRKHANALAIDGSITDRTEHDDKHMTRKHANALAIDGSITDRTEHDDKHMTREHANTLAIDGSITDRTDGKENITIYYGKCGSMECSFQKSGELISERFSDESGDITRDSESDEILEGDDSCMDTHEHKTAVKTVVYDAGINDIPLQAETKLAGVNNENTSIMICYGHGPLERERMIKKSVKYQSDSCCRYMEEALIRQRKSENKVKTVMYDVRSNTNPIQSGRTSVSEIWKDAGMIKQTPDRSVDEDEVVTIHYGSGSEKKECTLQLQGNAKSNEYANYIAEDAVRLMPRRR